MDNHDIYEIEIYPLMDKITDICEQHNIAFVASFDVGDGMQCSSFLSTVDKSAMTVLASLKEFINQRLSTPPPQRRRKAR